MLISSSITDHPEILAPVGGIEQLQAAVRCGADAVYFGTGSFNARRNGTNFDGEDLKEVIRYCHVRGVKCHVTVNTIVTESELDPLCSTIDHAVQSGADALILQDLAAVEICRNRWPDIPIHASTQMTVHNSAGVDEMSRLGFSRVVLARELSIPEIQSIHSHNSKMPLEVFVHGALCVCMSGNCYLSSVIGGRSGNRGLCAQPCRTDFRIGNRGYALSLKDLCAIPHMDALIRAGVSSFKIEGRMKRPEYVAAAVTACRDMLSGKKPDLELLQDVFSREGFTDGYLTGKRTSVMFGHRTKENVLSFKNAAGKLKALYASEVQRIPISFTFQAKAGQAVLLNASDGVHSVSVSGTIPEAARTMSLMEENVQHAIVQTGGTPYSADIINVSVDSGISVPLSDIKHLRREALEQLDSLRGNIPKRSPINQTPFLLKRSDSFPDNPKIRIRLNDWSQYSDSFRDYQLQIPYGKILSNPSQMLSLNQELIAELPVYVFPDHESSFLEKLKELKKLGIRHVISGNIGVLRYAKDMGFLLHGDYALNIANSVSASSYSEMGLLDLVLSFEIPIANAKAIAAAIPSGVLAYGYLPLMHFRSCPNRDRRGCSSCNGKIHRILDGKQIPFYLGCNDRTYSVLYNGTPLYIGDSNLSGLDFLTLFFSKESDREAEEVFRLFLNGEKADFPRTKGLYYRELK